MTTGTIRVGDDVWINDSQNRGCGKITDTRRIGMGLLVLRSDGGFETVPRSNLSFFKELSKESITNIDVGEEDA